MTPEQRKAVEYKAAVFAMLDKINEREMLSEINDDANSKLFEELVDRWKHAAIAFPGMTFEQYLELAKKRERKRTNPGKRGPAPSLMSRLAKPTARAARDVDRIRAYWEATPEGMAGGKPPIPHIDLAADWHDHANHDLGERVRRGKARNAHKLIERP